MSDIAASIIVLGFFMIGLCLLWISMYLVERPYRQDGKWPFTLGEWIEPPRNMPWPGLSGVDSIPDPPKHDLLKDIELLFGKARAKELAELSRREDS